MTILADLYPANPHIPIPERLYEGPAWPEAKVRARIRQALDGLYRERLERAELFGSRARGDGRADSDYDVAVVLRGYDGSAQERHRLSDLRQALLMETGEFIVFVPFAPDEYNDPSSLLLTNIRREGQAL